MKLSIFVLAIIASSCVLETQATIGEIFKLKAKLFGGGDSDDAPKRQPIVVHVHKSDGGNGGGNGGNGGGKSNLNQNF
jgi:hypothetical protein